MERAFERIQPVNGQDIVVDGGLMGGRLWSTQQESIKQMFGALTGSQASP